MIIPLTFKSGTWRLSNEQMTVKVETNNDGNIKTAAPIVHKFIGQPLRNLILWMRKPNITKLREGNNVRST